MTNDQGRASCPQKQTQSRGCGSDNLIDTQRRHSSRTDHDKGWDQTRCLLTQMICTFLRTMNICTVATTGVVIPTISLAALEQQNPPCCNDTASTAVPCQACRLASDCTSVQKVPSSANTTNSMQSEQQLVPCQCFHSTVLLRVTLKGPVTQVKRCPSPHYTTAPWCQSSALLGQATCSRHPQQSRDPASHSETATAAAGHKQRYTVVAVAAHATHAPCRNLFPTPKNVVLDKALLCTVTSQTFYH